MQDIINFSSYSVDLSRYDHSWDEVTRFVRREEFSGIELLLGGEHTATVPPDLVTSVHLPGWLGWIRLWREPETIPEDGDFFQQEYYFGGASRKHFMRTFRRYLSQAASVKANYAVFHITHIELDEFFTRNHRYTHEEVLSSAASFLNAACSVFPGGEPPVAIGFENLWWPGLTFLSEDTIDFFVHQLAFDNWIFVLDTGHMMNALQVSTEEEGIEKVLRTITRLSGKTLEKMVAVHFQCSTSWVYQKEHFFRPPPSGFESLSYEEQISLLMPMVSELDQHRPFTNPRCREIIDLVRPEYLVHEFTSRSREELEEKVRIQRETLYSREG